MYTVQYVYFYMLQVAGTLSKSSKERTVQYKMFIRLSS